MQKGAKEMFNNVNPEIGRIITGRLEEALEFDGVT